VATIVAGRRARAAGAPPLVWLALLLLGSLRSPLAPNVYVAAPALWLLALGAGELRGRPGAIAALVGAWVVIGGLPPLGSPQATIVGWMVGQLIAMAIAFWIVLRRHPQPGPA
jgi:hypothetical protein